MSTYIQISKKDKIPCFLPTLQIFIHGFQTHNQGCLNHCLLVPSLLLYISSMLPSQRHAYTPTQPRENTTKLQNNFFLKLSKSKILIQPPSVQMKDSITFHKVSAVTSIHFQSPQHFQIARSCVTGRTRFVIFEILDSCVVDVFDCLICDQEVHQNI